MEIEELKQLAESFFEWPTEDRTHVTLTSALLFAQHVLGMAKQQAVPVAYRITYKNGFDYIVESYEVDEVDDIDDAEKIEPLYAAPQPVQQQWNHPDIAPSVKAGFSRLLVVAVRRNDGKVCSFPAHYLNRVELCFEDQGETSGNWWTHEYGEEMMIATGWHDYHELDDYYEPLLNDGAELLAWCEMPQFGGQIEAAQQPVQPDQDRLRFQSACEISGDKHPEYVRGYEAAMDAVCRARKQQAEPVRWMYEDGSVGDIDCGHTCIPLYTAPPEQPKPIPRNERMPALADADPFGMVAWWNSFDNFWVLTNWDSKPARPIFTHWLPTGLKMPPSPGGSDE